MVLNSLARTSLLSHEAYHQNISIQETVLSVAAYLVVKPGVKFVLDALEAYPGARFKPAFRCAMGNGVGQAQVEGCPTLHAQLSLVFPGNPGDLRASMGLLRQSTGDQRLSSVSVRDERGYLVML